MTKIERDESTAKVLTVLVTVDTDAILRNSSSLSQNPENPTFNVGNCYLTVSGTDQTSGQGTSYLRFSANVRDAVQFYGTSGTHNMDDAVLLYRIVKLSGDDVFNPFTTGIYNKTVPVPKSDTEFFPANFEKANQFFYETTLKKTGKVSYDLYFALYTRVNDDLKLKGYFRFDPTIEVGK